MQTVETKEPEQKLEYGLEREYRQAQFTRRKRDLVAEVKDDLQAAGEDLRDWPLSRIKGLIEKGYLSGYTRGI